MIYYSIFLILFTITVYSIWYICYIYRNTCIIETFETEAQKRKRYGDKYDELVLNTSKTFDTFLQTQYTFQDQTFVPDSIKTKERGNWLPEKEEYIRQSVDCEEGWDYPNIDDAPCLLSDGISPQKCLSPDTETRNKIPQGSKKRNWIIKTNPKYGGNVCTSNYNILVETKQCPDLLCDVNCRGSWVQTGISPECEKHNAECGEQQLTTNAIRGKGRQEIYYNFNTIQHSSNNGIPCPLTNPNPRYQDCDFNKCPKKCIGNWNYDNVYNAQCVIPGGAVCDKSSGKIQGTRTRTYTIQPGNTAQYGGIACPFSNGAIDSVECDENCRVDCEYTDWSAPSGCTADTTSCGQQCIPKKTRSIVFSDKYGGTPCGSTTQDAEAVQGTKCDKGICIRNSCSYNGFPLDKKFVIKLDNGKCIHPNDGEKGINTSTKLITYDGCEQDRLYYNAIPTDSANKYYLQHTDSRKNSPIKCLKASDEIITINLATSYGRGSGTQSTNNGLRQKFILSCDNNSDNFEFIPESIGSAKGFIKNITKNQYWNVGTNNNNNVQFVENQDQATKFILDKQSSY
jgi:hypothetical protein